MATTEDDDVNSNVGEGSGIAEQDYFQIASVLQSRLDDATAGTGDGASELTAVLEIAAPEFGLDRGNQCVTMMDFLGLGVIPLVGIESEERRCTHSCSGRKEPMNPDLWGNLPPEVLKIVFAHLPLVAISSLKMLSKEWRQIVSSADFRQVCNEAYPRTVCLITRSSHYRFWVRVLDLLRQKWHTYKIRVRCPIERFIVNRVFLKFVACEDDQGLVCFATEWNRGARRKKGPPTYFFTVVNPLTGSHQELLPLSQCTRLRLVRIHVDGTTKAFKVFALARRLVWTEEGVWRAARFAKHEYDSRRGEWITTDGSDGFDPDRAGRLAYDFEKGRLFAQAVNGSVRMLGIRTTDLSKGRLFVLQLGSRGLANRETANLTPMYYIEEFHWQRGNWVNVDSHRCDPFERPPKLIVLRMSLHACDGFLMVIMDGDSRDNERFQVQLAWLYDLSTRKWSTLDHRPVLPVWRRTYDPIDRMIQPWDLSGGGRFGGICDNIYNISMMLEPKWVI